MNIIKKNQLKSKISKFSANKVRNCIIISFYLLIQNISIPTRKAFISSTMNNTNNNSITSINLNSNLKNKQKIKNAIYNQKMSSIKKHVEMDVSLGAQINLYKKKIFNQKNKNEIPISSVSHNSSQYIKYKYLNQQNNSNLKQRIFANKTNSNMIINNTNNNSNNISLSKNNKFTKKNILSKNKNPNIKSINTNNYIINTFNLSEKNYINNNTHTQKSLHKNITDEIIKFKKEKEEYKEKNEKSTKLIEKLIEDNKNLSDKINNILEENSKLKQKIKTYKENQDQLVMLIKIIQKNGVDIESVIDRWNNEVEEEEENEKEEKYEEITSKSLVLDSLNDLNEKIDCSSFIPIAMKELKTENKLKVTGVPKLNFDIIKNNQQLKRNANAKKQNKTKKKDNNILNKSK